MEETKDPVTTKGDTVAVERLKRPDHTDTIKSQVLARIGNVSQLHRVEVSKHHHGKYRVNIWQQPEPDKKIAVMPGPRIGLSYYLTVSDTGEIIHSNPPMTKVNSSTYRRG